MKTILNEAEIKEVRNFLRSMNEESRNLPLRKRKFYLCGGFLRLYYGPEQSRISLNHFIETLKRMPGVLGLKTKIEVEEVFYGIVVAKKIKEFYTEFEHKIKNDENYTDFLIEQYKKLKDKVILEFGKVNVATRSDSLSIQDLKQLEEAIINFRCLCLDDIIPIQAIKEKLNLSNEALHLLLVPRNGLSHYMSIHKGLLHLAKNPTYEEIKLFIEKAGYMAGDDLFRVNLETPEGVIKQVNIYKQDFHSYEEIEEEVNTIQSRVSKLSEKQNQLIERINNKKSLHNILVISVEYNELNRIFVKKYYKLIRELAEKNNLPLKYFSLDRFNLFVDYYSNFPLTLAAASE